MDYNNQHIILRNPLIKKEDTINITTIKTETEKYFQGQRFARERSNERKTKSSMCVHG
jgi:hypothetical protein